MTAVADRPDALTAMVPMRGSVHGNRPVGPSAPSASSPSRSANRPAVRPAAVRPAAVRPAPPPPVPPLPVPLPLRPP